MPRRTLKQNILQGVLSVNNVAVWCNVTPPTVRKWINKNLLDPIFKVPESTELRLSPKAIKQFMVERSIPVPDDMETALINFESKYNDDFSMKSDM